MTGHQARRRTSGNFCLQQASHFRVLRTRVLVETARRLGHVHLRQLKSRMSSQLYPGPTPLRFSLHLVMLWSRHDANQPGHSFAVLFLLITSLLAWLTTGRDNGVPGAPHIASLKLETEQLFYHGFENYMKLAFPEDELMSVSCKPKTRDRENVNHVEVNDALGNYSLTLIDSLSTLAILASSPSSSARNKPLILFQNGIKDIIEQYGDGSAGPKGQGKRARGFNLDSKVQVFETVIRGLGGLLSAHLFAVGELPVTGYKPPLSELTIARTWQHPATVVTRGGIRWQNGLVYDGQLLRLAYDLGNRLLPAFYSDSGLPYPRVNLRTGIPFYKNSPICQADPSYCEADRSDEKQITETCSAGAGSLVLEMTVLSRLTGDYRFEEVAKKAFWSVWDRRSDIDLVGAGIDAQSGVWQHAWTGIGAGIDSFFEYALKSHVLLSGRPSPPALHGAQGPGASLTDLEHSASSFLEVWKTAHKAINRHVLRETNFQHPHYIQVDLTTGAPRALWIDALSAYFPGLLVLSGDIEEAIQAHLLHTAIWARFSALPERYNVANGGIEGGLGWWPGRPELIESTYFLYRATEDPWYIYAGEMMLRDIKRRCWTRCGLAGIQNVLTGEKSDRMESFFLSETAKYLFLLFDVSHPLNKLDAPFVFSTEGHPLIIPASTNTNKALKEQDESEHNAETCPPRQKNKPFSISNIAARGDVYHAGSLARLHLMPERDQIDSMLVEHTTDHPSISLADVQSPSNYTQYPWTLPLEMIPYNVQSSLMPMAPTFELTFPNMPTRPQTGPPLQRVPRGLLIHSLGGLHLSLVKDIHVFQNNEYNVAFRVHSINNIAMGKAEIVYLTRTQNFAHLNPADPNFAKHTDPVMLDIVLDLGNEQINTHTATEPVSVKTEHGMTIEIPGLQDLDSSSGMMSTLLAQLTQMIKDSPSLLLPLADSVGTKDSATDGLLFLPAILPTGIGAAPLPEFRESTVHGIDVPGTGSTNLLDEPQTWTKIYMAGFNCDKPLPRKVFENHIIVIKRGECSFNRKLTNLPSYVPGRNSFSLVIVIDYETPFETSGASGNYISSMQVSDVFMTRPLLDDVQKTASGLHRRHGIPMIMVGGGQTTYEAFARAKGIGIKRRISISSGGTSLANFFVV